MHHLTYPATPSPVQPGFGGRRIGTATARTKGAVLTPERPLRDFDGEKVLEYHKGEYGRCGREKGRLMPNLTILEGDCLDVLATLPANSINLIVTSPPYGNQRKHTYGGIDPDKYVDWFIPRADEMRRVLRLDGSFVLNIKEHCENGERHTYVYELVIAMRKAGWRWADEYIWYKANEGVPGIWPNRLKDSWEHLYHFYLESPTTFYRDAVRRPLASSHRTRIATVDNSIGGFSVDRSKMNQIQDALPGNVLIYATSSSSDINGHNATFPRAIPEFFIKLFTLPGDTVLDPFAGSGTTLFQAYEMDRHSIGIEIIPEYCELMRERKNGLTMRLPGLDV